MWVEFRAADNFGFFSGSKIQAGFILVLRGKNLESQGNLKRLHCGSVSH